MKTAAEIFTLIAAVFAIHAGVGVLLYVGWRIWVREQLRILKAYGVRFRAFS